MNSFLEHPFATISENQSNLPRFAEGTPSAVETKKPWQESIQKIWSLPFYDDQERPSSEACKVASNLVQKSFSLSHKNGFDWLAPLVNSTDEGEIVLEWWQGSKKITLYIEGLHISFVRVWGPDIHNEMEEGQLMGWGNFFVIWRWLHS